MKAWECLVQTDEGWIAKMPKTERVLERTEGMRVLWWILSSLTSRCSVSLHPCHMKTNCIVQWK